MYLIYRFLTISLTPILNLLNGLKITYKNYILRKFVKFQLIKLTLKRIYKNFYTNFIRELNILPHKLYLYFNHIEVEFELNKII